MNGRKRLLIGYFIWRLRPMEYLALKNQIRDLTARLSELEAAGGRLQTANEKLAAELAEWAESGFLNIIGGCCGTTPAHIKAIAEAVAPFPPRKKVDNNFVLRLSGLEPCNIREDSLFVNVGERTNVTGSAKFKRLILEEQYDAALDVARDQVENGAQLIDINMDEGMLDGEKAMVTFLNLIASEPDISRVPIMLDSSKWPIIEAGLKCVAGKAIGGGRHGRRACRRWSKRNCSDTAYRRRGRAGVKRPADTGD